MATTLIDTGGHAFGQCAQKEAKELHGSGGGHLLRPNDDWCCDWNYCCCCEWSKNAKKTGGGGFDLKVGRLGPVNQWLHVYGFNTILCSIVLLTCNCLIVKNYAYYNLVNQLQWFNSQLFDNLRPQFESRAWPAPAAAPVLASALAWPDRVPILEFQKFPGILLLYHTTGHRHRPPML